MTNNAMLTLQQVEFLMEVTSALALQTQKVQSFPEVAPHLSAALNLPALSVAVIKSVVDGKLVLLSSTSKPHAPNLEQELLDLNVNTHAASGGQAAKSTAVISQAIDDKHAVLIAVHDLHGPLSEEVDAMLHIIAGHLSKSLSTLVMWLTYPRSLGEPFTRLTEREWVVLRHLDSDVGEKQLADQLQLSPHTLHSHIKAIYRKIGVQGRLSLLQRLDAALRAARLNRTISPVIVSALRHDVALASADFRIL